MCSWALWTPPVKLRKQGASEVAEALFMELSAEDEALQLGLSRNKAVVGEPSRRLFLFLIGVFIFSGPKKAVYERKE